VAELEQAFPGVRTTLVPSSGGVFLVTVDGEPVYSKKECGGRHAEPGEVVARIRAMRG
jgi:selT/selW/selH-like putative selenoprotein